MVTASEWEGEGVRVVWSGRVETAYYAVHSEVRPRNARYAVTLV